ncbi:MAG: glycoside hydrolase [Vicinamibacterales bacterium]|nr:glycoside hydrolase [Vicinamibacterales bacterium]
MRILMRLTASICIAPAMVVATACGREPAQPALEERRPAPIEPVRLAVAGAKNGMVSLAASGTHVVAVWTATRDDAMNIHAATSEDGGATFSTPVRVNDRDGDVSANAEQPPRVAVAGSDVSVIWPSRKSGTSAIRLSRSRDGGRSFGPAVTIHNESLPGARGWAGLAVDGEGTAHAVWLDGRDAVTTGHTHAGTNHAAMNHAAMKAAPRQDVYQALIAPDGRVTEAHVARDVCFCCKTAVGIGPSGRVNVAWRHIFPGSMRDIAMATSIDGGRHFSELARVSQDKWELSGCPDDGPGMAVGSHDDVHLVWPTLVNQAEPQKAIFYSTTTDGKTFSPRIRLSAESQSDAAHPQIAVDGAGNLAAVWDEQQGDTRQVIVRRMDAGATFGVPVAIGGPTSAFYPFVLSVNGSFLAAWTTGSGDASAIVVRRLDGIAASGSP